jgi:AAA ATPase domain/AAA domain, putative AbiEii toxin, Type IV TA system
MLLTSVQVKNFKCINDSNEFAIDEKVTCLVGKNESGKTALLQGISKLNPVDPNSGKFDVVSDFPRYRMIEYRAKAAGEPAEALSTRWILQPPDVEALAAVIGPEAQKLNSVTVSKGYDNQVRYSLELDEKAVVQHLIDSSGLTAAEKQGLTEPLSLKTLHERLVALKEPTQTQKKCLELVTKFQGDDIRKTVDGVLSSRIPKIAYFSEYLRMPGQVSVSQLKQQVQQKSLTEGHKVFLALLDMIGRSIDDLEKISHHEVLVAELEAASNTISREIFNYWSQNRSLKVLFKFDQGLPQDSPPFNSGWILRTRVENTRHGVSTIFDERSAGFVWFFSFLVWFGQVKKQFGERVVLLLDEPGLTLHAKAQADLLRYIDERLAPNYQVIYTTHSPFMIDPENLLRARTVEDVFIEPQEGKPLPNESELGTKVGGDVLSVDRDTLFPLQAALGYEITQTMFVGEHTLLVEGPSDLLYMQWFKRKLGSLGRVTLDPRWVIAPCGSVDKIPSFMALFAGNKLNIAVLVDFASGQKRRVRDLRETKLLREGHVFTVDTYAKQDEADIEDIIGRESYIELVARTYSLPGTKKLPTSRPLNAPIRVVHEVEDHFKGEKLDFDHYRPAEFMIQQGPQFTIPGLEAALDRFESLFKDLNSLLS